MKPYPWTCPFCDRGVTIADNDHRESSFTMAIDTPHGHRKLEAVFVVCPNPDCRQIALKAELYRGRQTMVSGTRTWEGSKLIHSWSLVPPSQAKVFPDYVPQPVRDDYQEACLIRDLSPKASATLSRRCLQGMIRDFWKVAKPKLSQEIEAINDKVDPLTWQAIDGVRSIGNIGAHMEKDINLIIDVEPEEASKLIWLIELLIKDWYIHRHEREEGLKAIRATSDAKARAKKAGKAGN